MDTAARLNQAFLKNHPDDCARTLEELPAEQSAALLIGFAPNSAGPVIQRMSPDAAAACLGSMPVSDAAPILAELAFDTIARIARHWAGETRATLIDALSPRTSQALKRLLDYDAGTVGALMDPMAFTLPGDLTVDEAKQRVNTATGNVHYDLFVVNREQKLVGVLNLRDFIQASPEARLDAIMNKQFVKLKSGASLEHAVSAADIGKVNSFPVVDKNDNLLGVLSTEILYEAIGRADPKRDKRDSVETVVALGELYWVTLSALFFRPHHQSQDIHKPTPETSDGR